MAEFSLTGCGAAELESRFAGLVAAPPLEGLFEGRMLRFLDTPSASSVYTRVLDTLLFGPRFGVDFERRLWWFHHPWIATGRFHPSVGPSRWRDAEVVRLEYDVSRLPRPIRGLLYDEVKPLDVDHALGLGGINAPRGQGEHFWFELRRLR